jgi:hypothetical protein
MKMHQPLSFVSLLATKSQMNSVPEGGTKLFASFRRCSADAKYHAGITCLIKKVALRGSSLCRWVRPLPLLKKPIPLCFLIVNRKIGSHQPFQRAWIGSGTKRWGPQRGVCNASWPCVEIVCRRSHKSGRLGSAPLRVESPRGPDS